jgi:hypothetical protein
MTSHAAKEYAEQNCGATALVVKAVLGKRVN